MLHRKQQRKIVNPPLRAICRPLNRSFSLSCFPSPSPPLFQPSSATNNGGVHLTVLGHKHGHKFFVADLTPHAWPTVNFSAFPSISPTSISFPSFPSSVPTSTPRARYPFDQRSKKAFTSPTHSRERPQPQSRSFLSKDTIIFTIEISIPSSCCDTAASIFCPMLQSYRWQKTSRTQTYIEC